MFLKLRGTVPVQIISAYAPTASSSDQAKDTFYAKLQRTYQAMSRRGPTYILGDFNTRLKGRFAPTEAMIGPH
eukprot:2119790-Prorocentrum_lima.AAC.1